MIRVAVMIQVDNGWPPYGTFLVADAITREGVGRLAERTAAAVGIPSGRGDYTARLAGSRAERERRERDLHWWEYAGERAHDPGCHIGAVLDG